MDDNNIQLKVRKTGELRTFPEVQALRIMAMPANGGYEFVNPEDAQKTLIIDEDCGCPKVTIKEDANINSGSDQADTKPSKKGRIRRDP